MISSIQEFLKPPLLITVFLGANDACLFPPMVHVPLNNYEANIRSFVESILVDPFMENTRILLITPPPVNVREAVSSVDVILEDEDKEEAERQFEEQCRDAAGFKTWVSKKTYAERIVQIAQSYNSSEYRDRLAVLDFWRALTDHALLQEGRGKVSEGPLDISTNGKWPGCGLPGAKEFDSGVFTDRLHLGEMGYWVLSDGVMEVLQSKWAGIL
jgi:lysophospholipase L1-like esterase